MSAAEVVIGIDPDIRGGVAFYHMITGDIHLYHMPTMRSHFGCKIKEKPRLTIDCDALYQLLDDIALRMSHLRPIVHIERVHSIKAQGITSAFTFGRTVGMIAGILMFLFGEENIREIAPQAWKRQHGLMLLPKDASRVVAIEKFPHLEPELRKKKDIGKADALWIALSR